MEFGSHTLDVQFEFLFQLYLDVGDDDDCDDNVGDDNVAEDDVGKDDEDDFHHKIPIKVVSCGSKTSDVQFEFLSPLYPDMLPNKTAQCDLTVSHNCESPICQVTTMPTYNVVYHFFFESNILTPS